MLQQGFEYGCMAQDTSLAFLIPYHPSKMAGSVLKPHAPALHCSRMNQWSEDDTPVLEWYNYVNTEELQVSTYATRPLVFVKADMSKIAQVTDNRFRAEWRKDVEHMPLVNWTKVGNSFSGIKVHPEICFEHQVNDLFPMWDVDTLVVWDATCITDVRAFRNVGEWLYEVA
jgi:hypothetical protein